jgi:RNA polymerase sigma-70 factor (ECF subfamily)
MTDTPVSLLERLAQPQPRPADWDRLEALYRPWLRAWLLRQRLQSADVDDRVQNVLTVLVKKLPHFQHNGRPGAFRTWLRSVLAKELNEFFRKKKYRPLTLGEVGEEMLAQLAQDDSPLSKDLDRDHDRHVLSRLLDLIKSDFEDSTWQAFSRSALEGRDVATVAAELGMTSNAVCIARSRVLRRLREEARGLVDD